MKHDPNLPQPSDPEVSDALLRALFHDTDEAGVPDQSFVRATMAKVERHRALWQAVQTTLFVIVIVCLGALMLQGGPATVQALNQSFESVMAATGTSQWMGPREIMLGAGLLGVLAAWLYAEKA
jgi:hypothetical protein